MCVVISAIYTWRVREKGSLIPLSVTVQQGQLLLTYFHFLNYCHIFLLHFFETHQICTSYILT